MTHDLQKAFQQYRRKQIVELRPWQRGDNMTRISVSVEDAKAGSPKPGDMIARNPKNHADQWLVAAAYFADNFEALTAFAPAAGIKEAFELFDGIVGFPDERGLVTVKIHEDCLARIHAIRIVLRDVPGMCDGHDGYAVAVTSAHSLLSVEEAKANARLIAAAPMMFEYIAKKAAEGDEDARALLAEYSITKRAEG